MVSQGKTAVTCGRESFLHVRVAKVTLQRCLTTLGGPGRVACFGTDSYDSQATSKMATDMQGRESGASCNTPAFPW